MNPKIKALLDQIHSGKMQSDKARILDFVKKYPKSNKVLIGKYLSLPHQTVTARLSDLEDMGAIEAKTNGDYSEFYFIEEPNRQRIYAAARQAVKIEQWANKALTQFKDNLRPETIEAIKNELKSPSYVRDL